MAGSPTNPALVVVHKALAGLTQLRIATANGSTFTMDFTTGRNILDAAAVDVGGGGYESDSDAEPVIGRGDGGAFTDGALPYWAHSFCEQSWRTHNRPEHLARADLAQLQKEFEAHNVTASDGGSDSSTAFGSATDFGSGAPSSCADYQSSVLKLPVQ